MSYRIILVFCLITLLTSCQRQQTPPLIAAAAKSNVREVEALLKNDADVNQHDAGGRTPLIFAAMSGNQEIVRLLLHHRANVNAVSVSGRSPLMYSAEIGNIPITKLLLNAGADIHLRDRANQTAILLSAYGGHVETVKLLNEAGATKGELIESLIAAAGQGKAGAVQYLISIGIPATATNQYGVSAHSVALNNNQQKVLQLLNSFEK